MSDTILSSRFAIVKGMTNMRHKKEVLSIVKRLVNNYSEYHSKSGNYILPIEKIDEIDLWKFASLIMKLDDDRAMEATGPDNPCYSNKLLPALTKLLSHPIEHDAQRDFIDSWREGVGEYFKPLLEELIEEYLQEYNSDRGLRGEGYYESLSNFI